MSTFRTIALLGAAALVSASAAACSSSAAGTAPPNSKPAEGSAASGAEPSAVTIRGTSMLRFDPATVRVHVGTVQVHFVDLSSYPHDVRVPKLGVTSKTVTGNPGESDTTLTLRFPHPGVYPFECTYHDSAGMRGKFVVGR